MKQYQKVIVLSFLISNTIYAEVIPDGKTPTTVQILPSRKEVISIAAPNAFGVSLNQYKQFNVGAAGVDLNNTLVGAKTIINEVTSLSKSHLNGKLQVIGNGAHVIIANPNGIQVDSGEFINTKGTILTTGKLKLLPGTNVNSQMLEITTQEGLIDIVGKGLVGTFEELDLIAKAIRIDGQVQETSLSPRTGINLLAGSNVAKVDASALSAGPESAWLKAQKTNSNNQQDAYIDISPLGNLRAGSLTLVVTEKGVGVSHQGKMWAASGNFTITSEGKVTVKNGIIESAGDLAVIAKDDITNLNGKWYVGKNSFIHTDGNLVHSWGGDFHDAVLSTFSEKAGHSWGHSVTKKGFSVDYGQTEGNAPEIWAQDSLNIEAKNIDSKGGLFKTTSGDLTIKSETLQLNSFQSGNFTYTRTCDWFCHDENINNVVLHTASVLSGGKVVIDISGRAEQTAATIMADAGVSLKIPQPIFKSFTIVSPVQFKSNLFNSSNAHYSNYVNLNWGGVVYAAAGRVTFETEKPILNQGWNFGGGEGVTYANGMTKLALPTLSLPNFSTHIGFGRSLLF